MRIGRRKVLELSVVFTGAAMTGAASVLASACSDETGTTNPPATKDAASTTDKDAATKTDAATDATPKTDATTEVVCRSSITQNHGHTVTIPIADLTSGTAKTYSIKGTSDHDHQITLDPSQLGQLKSGVSVQTTSTSGGTTHDHQVTILCA
ncbi:MAG: hypothetical protein JST00_16345 [Deltaproteobacteria bacterium]|nr:hypothetical protein [Deltaproteobacteria bacterium]